MMDSLVKDYDVQLIEPGCAPGASHWNALLSFPNDISDVFPYLNALFEGVWYDHQNKTLIWRKENQIYAFRPQELRIAQVRDLQNAREIADEIIARINHIWRDREQTTPRYTERTPPSVIEIYKLLPQTNCRQCGYLSCMAFAADLRQNNVPIGNCPPLGESEHLAKKDRIENLFTAT
jgi:ArsR family metal-binding transcriptional regulator